MENSSAESELNVEKSKVNEKTYTRDEVKLYFSINFIYGIIEERRNGVELEEIMNTIKHSSNFR